MDARTHAAAATGDDLSIVAAMNDRHLFGPFFKGPSWDPWRVVLKGAHGLPMTEDEVGLFFRLAARKPPTRPVRELIVIAGRRAGKDSIASLSTAYAAAMFEDPEGKLLRPGERASVICLATDRDQAGIILRYIRSYFTDIDVLRDMVVGEGTKTGFELTNGVEIIVLPANFKAPRGRAILRVVFDEVAYWRDEASANPDIEVYNAVRPGLASIPGAMMICISSPYRKSGLLYRKYVDHYAKDSDDVLVIKAPTRDLNPLIDQSVIDQAYADDPAVAAAEWGAEFRDDIAGWAGRDLIEAAVDRGVVVRPYRQGNVYTSFVDASGGVRDSFTAAVAHAEKASGTAGHAEVVLDCLVEIRPPFNPDSATERIAEVLKSYGCRSTTGDRYGAQWVVNAFQKCGITFKHSERDRSAIYVDMLPLITTGRARLLDNARLISQFAGLERRTSSLGKDRVDHGPGGSDDVANSAAGALVLAVEGRQPMVISDALLARARQPTRWARRFGAQQPRTDDLRMSASLSDAFDRR